MTVSKTKAKLVDVARQLFCEDGSRKHNYE